MEYAGPDSGFANGQQVFGFTLFGAYSERVLVPGSQIRHTPRGLTCAQAAALPAVSATALHAISLVGGWPTKPYSRNKAALVHSAAGGVGSFLVQMLKLCGYSPVVGVVGAANKVNACYALGAHAVIDKSAIADDEELWAKLRHIAPLGFAVVFDANGKSTLQASYNNLSRNGRLVTFGFASNIPKATDLISPMSWIRMAKDLFTMPKFDPMDMCLNSKAVLGFNLSFFADEEELVEKYMNQIVNWIEDGKLEVPKITEFPMAMVREAHRLIQSGKSVGKIVVSI